MKKIIYILMGLSLLTTLSCSKWLNVEPKAEIKSDVMFETEQGFKDAIIGCYIMMSDPSLYGGELTCTFLDVIAQQYEFLGNTSSEYNKASQYIYSDPKTKTRIDAIWSKMYNILANVNNIIENIEIRKNVLHPTNYAMLKAEAYSLRAFLHFDLIRLFSYGNLKERKDVLSMPSIPYVKVYDKIIVKQSTLQEVLAYLHSDINTAIDLFYAYDPYSPETKPEGYEVPNEDLFYDVKVRPYRFGLKSALATRMRIHMWEGDYENALPDAEVLIKATNSNSGWATSWISDGVINSADEKLRDLTFSTEQLFGVETFQRFDKLVKNYFKQTSADDLNLNYQCLFLSKTRVESIFEINSGVGASDYRYTRLFDKTTQKYTFLKFWEYEKMSYKNNMPIIKKPEVYYTAVECLLNRGDEENKRQAIRYLNLVRNARGISSTANLSLDLTSDAANEELYKEWRKEFIGDGQMFYYYKRLGYLSIPNTNAPGNDALYILPLPEMEVDLGGRFDPNKKL